MLLYKAIFWASSLGCSMSTTLWRKREFPSTSKWKAALQIFSAIWDIFKHLHFLSALAWFKLEGNMRRNHPRAWRREQPLLLLLAACPGSGKRWGSYEEDKWNREKKAFLLISQHLSCSHKSLLAMDDLHPLGNLRTEIWKAQVTQVGTQNTEEGR